MTLSRWPRAIAHPLACSALTAFRALTALAAISLAGCAAPPPATTLLTLPPRLASAPEAPLDATRVLQLARLTIPEYLTARSARYRADDHTLAPWPATVWAERLEVALTRDLAAALRLRLPGWQVCEDHCPATPSHRLTVELDALEHQRSAHTLQARAHWSWQAMAAQSAPPTTGQRSGTINGLADTPQAGAAAMAVWIDQLADTIAAPLKQAATTTASTTAPLQP